MFIHTKSTVMPFYPTLKIRKNDTAALKTKKLATIQNYYVKLKKKKFSTKTVL